MGMHKRWEQTNVLSLGKQVIAAAHSAARMACNSCVTASSQHIGQTTQHFCVNLLTGMTCCRAALELGSTRARVTVVCRSGSSGDLVGLVEGCGLEWGSPIGSALCCHFHTRPDALETSRAHLLP